MSKLSEHIKDIGRFDHILGVFFEQGFDYFINKINLSHRVKNKNKSKPSKKIKQEVRLRKAFENLGPAFIKLGQILSVRPDMIPESYCNELRKLQEHVQPVEFDEIKKIIEKETKQKIHDLFKDIEKTPIATASLAQVHRATLITGEKVAVKVLKPNTKEIIIKDLHILFFIAHLIDKHLPKLRNYNFVEIVKEYSDWTLREIDFRKEANNIKLIKNNLKNEKVIIPKVYDKFTTEELLIMEFENGQNVYNHNFKSENERKEFCQELVNIYSKMIFIDGFFHADPHPGNIFVSHNNTPLLLDFGMVGIVNKQLRQKISEVLISIISKDVEAGIKGIISLSEKNDDADIPAFKNEAKKIIKNWYKKSIGECSFIKTGYNGLNAGIRNGMIFPANIILLAKSMVNLEGIGLEIYSKANVEELMRPNIEKVIQEKYNPVNLAEKAVKDIINNRDLYANLPSTLTSLIRKIQTGKFDFHLDDTELKDIEKHIDNSSSKKSLAWIISALFIVSPAFFFLDKTGFLGINIGYITFLIAFILLIKFLKLVKK